MKPGRNIKIKAWW